MQSLRRSSDTFWQSSVVAAMGSGVRFRCCRIFGIRGWRNNGIAQWADPVKYVSSRLMGRRKIRNMSFVVPSLRGTPVMFSVRIGRLVLSLSALLCASVSAQRKPLFTSPLPTGVRLDPAGEAVELGSLPINLVLTPEKDRVVVVLSGWREQGIQVVDLKKRTATQTLLQDGAFYGAAFSPDGHRLCVSGGNTDLLFVYAWKDGVATLESKFELAKAKTSDGTGTSYPAGLAYSA